jgi:hypothetical protein
LGGHVDSFLAKREGNDLRSGDEVVERVGLLPAAQAAHIDSRTLTFVDANGRDIGTISP